MQLLASVVSADVPLTPENVRPGWVAMLIVGVLILATVVLFTSFVKHARRARQPWPGEGDDDSPS